MPIHTAKDTKAGCLRNRKVLSKWPTQSPYLNLIENLLQRRVQKRNLCPANKHKLYVALKEEWETIPRKTYNNKKYSHFYFALMFKYAYWGSGARIDTEIWESMVNFLIII